MLLVAHGRGAGADVAWGVMYLAARCIGAGPREQVDRHDARVPVACRRGPRGSTHCPAMTRATAATAQFTEGHWRKRAALEDEGAALDHRLLHGSSHRRALGMRVACLVSVVVRGEHKHDMLGLNSEPVMASRSFLRAPWASFVDWTGRPRMALPSRFLFVFRPGRAVGLGLVVVDVEHVGNSVLRRLSGVEDRSHDYQRAFSGLKRVRR